MGHLFRSLEIDRALAPHEVAFLTGGAPVEAALPGNVREVRLPPLMMDETFSTLLAGAGRGVEEVMEERRGALLAALEELRPDVLLVELFPFGRKRFGFELLPALEAARQGRFGPVKVACSLRDILVEKADQAKYEARVLEALNPHFDLLLVHADPALVRLEETFSRTADIACPVAYTGYVAPRPAPEAVERIRAGLAGRFPGAGPLVVASAGGGKVGGDLLEAVVRASLVLAGSVAHRLAVFTGPFAPAGERTRLEVLSSGAAHVSVAPFTDHFPELLAAADLSVSMAGYNTTMNLLAGETYGLVLPFAQNREQGMRAERLAERGLLGLLEPGGLAPGPLAARLAAALRRATAGQEEKRNFPSASTILLDGADTTARLLIQLAGERR
jgi:predicted glycosyltransferase